MMVVAGLFPFILIFGVMVIGILIFKTSQRKGYHLGGRIKWVLGGYTAVLLAASLLSVLLLPAQATSSKTYSVEQMKKISEKETRVFEEAKKGTYDAGQTAFEKTKVWSIPFNEKTITLSDSSVSVFVEQDGNSKAGTIEAAYYTGKLIINRVDVTQKLEPVNLSLAGSDLSITSPGSVIKMNFFQPGFAFSQFSNGAEDLPPESEAVIGSGFVYLKVPQGVTVKGEVTYVN